MLWIQSWRAAAKRREPATALPRRGTSPGVVRTGGARSHLIRYAGSACTYLQYDQHAAVQSDPQPPTHWS